MFRRGVILLLVMLLCAMSIPTYAATEHPVSADQIIIAEPTTEKITNDKQVYLTVNITNTKVMDHPIVLSLVRVDNRLPFAESLSEKLNVSVMKLSSSAASDMSRTTKYNANYSVSEPEYSVGFEKETLIINRYFELKDLILSHNYEIATLNRENRFDLIAGNDVEIAKLSLDAKKSFDSWSTLKEKVVELRKEYAQVQVQYIKFFEKQIISDKIDRLSYFNSIGKLSNGAYKLRFIDETGQLIKEFSFEVIDRQETIKIIEGLPNKPN